MDTRFKNTDFFIEDIDESVKDLTVNDSSVSHLPANTDFFIENIDNNVIEICTDRGITPTTVSAVPANTDFFIVNIDSNVKKIATDLSITPSSVQKVPANTDFFIENIYFNIILICEELNIEPYEISVTPTNTDFFIEAIAKNVEKIMEAQTEIHVSGTFIHAVLSADSKISDYELEGNATQDGTPTPDSPVAINTVTGENTLTVTGKNLFDPNIITENYDFTYDATTGYLTGKTGKGTAYMLFETSNPQTVTITIEQPLGQSTAGLGIRFNYNDGTHNDVYPWNYSTQTKIVQTSNKPVLSVGTVVGNILNINSYRFQLELGNSASSFEPYQAQSQTIDLGSIELAKIGTYQDKIYYDADTSKWMLHKEVGKVVLDGSETWTKTNLAFQTVASITPNFLLWANMTALSNNFTHHYYASSISSNIQNGEFGWSGASVLTMRYDSCSTASDFKTWLSTHNATVYYALATPTDTEITDETLLSQLNAIYDIELKEGTVNISITATSPNLPASLKATIIPKE